MDMKVDGGPGGLTRVPVDYPSNAHKRQEKTETKKVEKVVQGKVTRQKKTFGSKLWDTFVGYSIPNVANYILYDVIIPAAKSTIYDAVKGGFEMALFGEKQDPRITRSRGQSHVNYNSISAPSRNERLSDSDRYKNSRARHNFDDIKLETKGEAEEVLSHLADLVFDYRQATVYDLYDLVGITGEFTDHAYGWTDLRGASATRARSGGYLLSLPRPIRLD